MAFGSLNPVLVRYATREHPRAWLGVPMLVGNGEQVQVVDQRVCECIFGCINEHKASKNCGTPYFLEKGMMPHVRHHHCDMRGDLFPGLLELALRIHASFAQGDFLGAQRFQQSARLVSVQGQAARARDLGLRSSRRSGTGKQDSEVYPMMNNMPQQVLGQDGKTYALVNGFFVEVPPQGPPAAPAPAAPPQAPGPAAWMPQQQAQPAPAAMGVPAWAQQQVPYYGQQVPPGFAPQYAPQQQYAPQPPQQQQYAPHPGLQVPQAPGAAPAPVAQGEPDVIASGTFTVSVQRRGKNNTIETSQETFGWNVKENKGRYYFNWGKPLGDVAKGCRFANTEGGSVQIAAPTKEAIAYGLHTFSATFAGMVASMNASTLREK